MRNVQILAVLSNNYVDLLFLRDRVFMPRNGEILASQSRMKCRFANGQDSRFQAANVSNMGIDVATSKKSRFSM